MANVKYEIQLMHSIVTKRCLKFDKASLNALLVHSSYHGQCVVLSSTPLGVSYDNELVQL